MGVVFDLTPPHLNNNDAFTSLYKILCPSIFRRTLSPSYCLKKPVRNIFIWNIPIPPYTRKIWYCYKADFASKLPCKTNNNLRKQYGETPKFIHIAMAKARNRFCSNLSYAGLSNNWTSRQGTLLCATQRRHYRRSLSFYDNTFKDKKN